MSVTRKGNVKFIFKTIFLLVLAFIFVLVAVLLLSPQQHSLIDTLPTLTHDDVKKARELLARNDPRKLRSGSVNQIRLDEQSLSLLGTYALQTLNPVLSSAGVQADLNDNDLQIKFSTLLPKNPLGPYFNLKFALARQADQLKLHGLEIGPWKIPDAISIYIPILAENILRYFEVWQLGQTTLVDYRFNEQALIIHYRWQSAWEELARAKIRELTDYASMNFYAAVLYDMLNTERASIDKVITSLFKQAQRRSAEHNAVEENRAILQLLGQWALGKQTYGEIYLPYFSLKLNGRGDLAQHLLVSAGIASHSNKDISNLIGTGKEISDSDGGSGFDFSDLAADRTGSLLGKLATQDYASAIKAQQLLSQVYYSSTLLPDITDFPRPLNKQQFITQYGNIRDKRYQDLVGEIDSEIKMLPFFKQMGM